MGKHKHIEEYRKQAVELDKAKLETKGQVERSAMEQRGKEIKVLVFGLFTKPKRTNDFWVILPRELDLDEIETRINNCFGDLKS